MRVIGTAGHVDHGKSTLVEALTGTHPDRLKEEREREMTIDLGFAWMELPGGEEVGIVDVPGHRDFIENMLAGVAGIDAALFVVAADEGVMPQTREHLAILDILQIQGGVVALTKIDMLGDDDASRAEWLDLVEEDLRKALAGTILSEAPIIQVSARTREGIPTLIQALSASLAGRPPRSDTGRPRLPIDRIFTIAGFGTVVTGTLSDGHLKIGDEVQILPGDLRGRIRGLQTHKRKEEIAVPGSRTAVNISGINVEQIQRGDVVAHPGDYQTTRRLDVRFRLLKDASQHLEHNTEVKLYIGAAEVVSRLRLLGSEILQPGEEGWLQLELAAPVVAMRGDHYILRRPSPGETLGGGIVVDPNPKGRHKRFNADVLERLESLTQGTPDEVLLQSLAAFGIAPVQAVLARAELDDDTARQALRDLLQAGQVVDLEDRLNQGASVPVDAIITSQGYWERLTAQAVAEVEAYHHAYPLRKGMPREELKNRMKFTEKDNLTTRTFSAILRRLRSQDFLEEAGPLVLHPGYRIQFSPDQQRQVDGLLARFAASPYAPPSIKESQAEVGEEVYSALVDLEKLVPLSPEVVFRKEDYQRMVNEVRRLLELQETITAAQVRDHFNTSRRYILALLEHLDATGMTIRVGDFRRLKT